MIYLLFAKHLANKHDDKAGKINLKNRYSFYFTNETTFLEQVIFMVCNLKQQVHINEIQFAYCVQDQR